MVVIRKIFFVNFLFILVLTMPVYALFGRVVDFGTYHHICFKLSSNAYNFIINHSVGDSWPCGNVNISDNQIHIECVSQFDGAHLGKYTNCLPNSGKSCGIFDFDSSEGKGILSNGWSNSQPSSGTNQIKNIILNGYAYKEFKSILWFLPDMPTNFYSSDNSCPPAIITSTNPSNTSVLSSKINTITINTDIDSVCTVSDTPNLNMEDMTVLTVDDLKSHSFTFEGNDSTNYTFYIKCIDEFEDINEGDYVLSYFVNYNNLPTITSTPITNGRELELYAYNVTATDLDNDNLIFSDNTTLFDINSSTGVISFIPTIGGNYVIRITVADGIETSEQIFNLNIELVNNAPVMESLGNSTLIVNKTFIKIINATDPDGDGLKFSENTVLFDIDPITGLINFTPSVIGLFGINITVTDNNSLNPKNATKTLLLIIKILPNIILNSPSNDSINVSIDTNITIYFSENINKSDLESLIKIKSVDGEEIIGIFNDNTLNQSFNPILLLKPNTTYIVNVSQNIKDLFGNNLDKEYIWTFTTELKDTDKDGIPDYEDSDVDNDGIDNNLDFLIGNISNINNNFFNLIVKINSDENISKNLTETNKVEFLLGENKLLEFEFNFSNSSILDLTNLSIINASNSTIGAIIIHGLRLSQDSTKTVYLERINPNINGVCIKDEEIIQIKEITNSCGSSNEFKVECDGSSQNRYTCVYNSSTNLYKVTGLSHSGIIQLSYNKPSDGGSSDGGNSGGGGGGSSGGGGGGGGTFGYVCNTDWQCSEWSACINAVQTRQCSFVKVPQHVQDAPCQDSSNGSATTQTCEVTPPSATAFVTSTETQEQPQLETLQIALKSNQTTSTSGLSAITGAVTQVFTNPKAVKEILIVVVVIVLVVVGYVRYRFIHKKKKSR